MARLKVRPTRSGEAHAVTQIAAHRSGLERALERAAGADQRQFAEDAEARRDLLLNGTDESRRDQPVLAFQRYGRGKAFAFSVQDSWLWQMHATMPLEDMTHENFWRQLLRWVVDGVPEAVEAHTSTERVEAGESVTLDRRGRRQVLRRVERCARRGQGQVRRQHRRRADELDR